MAFHETADTQRGYRWTRDTLVPVRLFPVDLSAQSGWIFTDHSQDPLPALDEEALVPLYGECFQGNVNMRPTGYMQFMKLIVALDSTRTYPEVPNRGKRRSRHRSTLLEP